jgi:5-methylcytosine-specific restriction endonuclease McrA
VLHQLETHFTERYSRYIEYEQAKFGVTLPLENLLRHMDRSEWVKRVNVPVRIIISEVESLNDFYLRTWQNVMQFEKADSLVKRCVDQCPERPLLLGIYTQFEWLERIESRLLSLRHHIAQPESVLTYSQMDHPTITSSQATNAANHQVRPTRKRIPKALRRRVWTKRNGTEIIGRCFTCGCSIDYDAFECGHVVAAARGGKAILSNLEPICGVCNRDMQTTNLHSYRAEMTTLI